LLLSPATEVLCLAQGSYLPSVLEENEKRWDFEEMDWGRSGKIPEGFGGKSATSRYILGAKVRISGKMAAFGHLRPILTVVPKEIGRVMEALEGFGGVFENAHEKNRRKIRLPGWF
jgi:hypothetical protein